MASPEFGLRTFHEKLGIKAEFREQLYLRAVDAADARSLNYWLELLFAAGIATFGLVLNSPAVVIGAMLISPLMGPILSGGLALAAADLYLGTKVLLHLTLSILAAVAISGLLVWMLPFQSPTGEILARTQPNLLDLGVALFSGLAGSLVLCRGGGGGGVTALPGVAIAVALMPPLCTVGFGVGSGWSWTIISGAGLLFLTNLAAITASAFLVFLVARMHTAEMRPVIIKAIRERGAEDPLFRLLRRTRLSRSLAGVGQLRWRALMLLVVLATLFVPLRQAFLQVRDETAARNAVADVVRRLCPPDSVVTRQVDVSGAQLSVRLIVTNPVDGAAVANAERELIRRTGKEVRLSVRKVAGEEELALLRERLRAPAPPSIPDIAAMRAETLARVEGPLKELWPAARAEMTAYEVAFTAARMIVRVSYKAGEPLDDAAREVLANALRSRVSVQELEVDLQREPPAEPEKAAGRRAAKR